MNTAVSAANPMLLHDSFIELTARERARSLLDAGTFRELLGPFDRLESPWLPLQGIVCQADDGVVIARGTIDGEPADVHERVLAYGRWAARSPRVPKLVMTVESGVGMGSAEVAEWAATTFAGVEVESVGPAGHHAPEDQPDAIGAAVARWLTRHGLADAS